MFNHHHLAAIYLFYSVFNVLFSSNPPHKPHSISSSLAPSRRTDYSHETPLVAQQQNTHNSHASIEV